MSLIEAISTVFKKYFDFTGRARRSEYWYYVLFYTIAYIVMMGVAIALVAMDGGIIIALSWVVLVAIALPFFALTARRLHDTGRSGWWQLVSLIPLIGFFVLLYWMILGSDDGDNSYGERPY